jgi:hypothetical protein
MGTDPTDTPTPPVRIALSAWVDDRIPDNKVLLSTKVLIDFDGLTDVVSVYLADTMAAHFGPAPTDHHMLVERDEGGRVVGVEVLGASALVPSFWNRHPDRHILPSEILDELDRWLKHHWADLGRAHL